MPRYWQLALGVLFVLVIVYLRGGVAGAIAGLFARRPGLSMAELLRTEGLTKRFQGLVATDHVDFQLASSDALHHRAERRRQDHLHQHDLGPPPGRAPATSGTRASASPARPSRPAPSGDRPQVPDAERVRQSVGVREHRAGCARLPRGRTRARIARVLRLVRLEHQTGILARNLSHGQRQWLEIGLLANDAKLLLLDEPTAGMTAEETSATGELIRQLIAELQVAAIIIEHDINFIRRLRAPITVMHLGRVLVEGAFDEIERDVEVREVYLGAEGMTSKSHQVTAGYGPITVLREVSMQVGSGEVLGVLGRNGMGKSTLIRCLSGLIRPTPAASCSSGGMSRRWPRTSGRGSA